MATKKTNLTPDQIAQEIVANAENANVQSSQATNPVNKIPQLATGQSTQSTFNINSFDPRFPTGFVTIVTDKNDNPVGYIKNGKVVPLLEPGYSLAEVQAQKDAKNAPIQAAKNKLESTKSSQTSSFNYAQSLQQTAEQEYQQMLTSAQIVSRGEAMPEQKTELENYAKEYASTMAAIKSAYQKSGAVQGELNLEPTGKLAQGVTYIDPLKPEIGPQTVTKQGIVTQTAPIPAGTNAGPNAVVANNQKIATIKPSVTPPVDPAAATAATIAAAIAKANGGNYTTSKGILSLNNNPYSGEYQGKYYANGKLETTAQIKADFLSKYGEQAKFIASVPELGNLLTTAIAQNWAPTQWATQFANTQWAQQHPGDIGLAEIQRISAPSEYALKYNTAQNHIASLAASTGMKLTSQQLGAQITDPTKTTSVALDQEAVNGGQDLTNWLMQNPNASDAQIIQQMAKYGTIDPATGPGGNVKTFSNSLQSLAQQYGVLGQVSTDGTSKVFDNLAVKEAASGANLSDPAVLAKYENQYKTQAMATYKPFADQIANGAKVSDLASPYLNTYASLMEVSPSDIQLGALTGPGAMVSKALIGDANGQIVNPYDFASQVRSQPAWLNTQNAHATVNSAADYMISKMGMG